MARRKLYGRNMEPLLEYRSRLDTCRLLLNAVYKWAAVVVVVVWADRTRDSRSTKRRKRRKSSFRFSRRASLRRIDKTIRERTEWRLAVDRRSCEVTWPSRAAVADKSVSHEYSLSTNYVHRMHRSLIYDSDGILNRLRSSLSVCYYEFDERDGASKLVSSYITTVVTFPSFV